MKIPLSWLRDYVDINLSVEELGQRLTLAGIEVAGIERIGAEWERDKLFVGEIVRIEPHPDADRLVLATVRYGGDAPLTVVTGAPNLYPYKGLANPGLKAPFAISGARLLDGHSAEAKYMRLKPSKIRGIRSEGMVCSEKELGLSDSHEGVLILPPDAPVGMPLVDYLGDTVLEIELTPNLGRCLSLLGVAREVAALEALTLKRTQPLLQEIAGRVAPSEVLDPAPVTEPFCQIVIEAPDLCPRYTAILIRNVKIEPSPRWLQERLRLAGQRPINNVVDITNYVMLEWGQPLHAFDYDALVARAQRSGQAQPTIYVRRAQPGERMTTLDNVDRLLSADMLLIADGAGAIAVAGVMGGEETEVKAHTVNVLLESACFNNINNRRTAQALKLFSEASGRFGRGIPATLAPLANRRAAQLMAELAGGVVTPGVQDAYPARQRDITIALTNAEVERLLGVPIAPADLRRTLEAMECRVLADEQVDGMLRVTVPWHRLDLEIPADLVEEVARGIGYDKIPSTLLASALPAQWRNWPLEAEEAIRTLLAGCGLQDTINYPLISESDNARLLAADPGVGWTAAQATAGYQIPALLRPADSVQLANPLSVERSVLRSSLLPNALQVMAANLRYSERWAAFEIGRVYWPLTGQLLPQEARHLSLVMAGPRTPAGWQGASGEELDFYDLKGVIETLLARSGAPLSQARFVATAHPAFTRRVARIEVAGQDIGIVGELHPAVRRAFDLPAQGRVVAAELSLAPLFTAYQRDLPMQPISAYPAIKEDLAVIVDEALPADQVAAAIAAAGGELLTGLRLFDLYRGDQIGAGLKSLAYRVTYQATDRSLTDADAAKVRAKIVRRLEETLGARLRAAS